MARFYGVVQGQRGKASRLGSQSSGLDVTAASWSGAVRTRLNVRDGVDWATVELTRWHGIGTSALLYDGPCDGSSLEQTARVA